MKTTTTTSTTTSQTSKKVTLGKQRLIVYNNAVSIQATVLTENNEYIRPLRISSSSLLNDNFTQIVKNELLHRDGQGQYLNCAKKLPAETA